MRIPSRVRLLIGAGILIAPRIADAQRLGALRETLVHAIRGSDSAAVDAPIHETSAVEVAGSDVSITFESPADSAAWARAKAVADNAKGLHVTVSLKEKRLWVVSGQDTMLNAPVAVAKGETLEIQGRRWKFVMPRGVRTVLGKQADPVWVPPDWLYAETAAEYGLSFTELHGTVKLADGRKIAVRDNVVGLIVDGEWSPLPTDEHIIFNDTLYIPPAGTINRRIEGQLGKYRLDLGDGFLLHGTPYQASIGQAATHGCVRLRDADIQWLYENIPVGTKVYVY